MFECTCVHNVLCTFVLPNQFSVLCTLVCQIGESGFMLKPDFVYYAVHMYLTVFVWPPLCWPETGFFVQIYTPEVGRLRCFHHSLSPILRPCVCAPHSEGPQVREEDEENGLGLSPPPLCLFRSAPESGVT